jgi:DNA-binding MarR family transcriptional regulator/GNAT superfamily N-acetyltransferase
MPTSTRAKPRPNSALQAHATGREPETVSAIRRFNRLYTRQLGLLGEGLHDTRFSLTEARVLYELGQAQVMNARDLAHGLQLDAGYLSRLLTRLQARKLLRRVPDPSDARIQQLQLSAAGRTAFERLGLASSQHLQDQIAHLGGADQQELLAALATVERLWLRPPAEPPGREAASPDAARREPFIVRDPAPGDMGWIVHRQAVMYAQEYGWDNSFEALVAEIVAKFVQKFDARRERCWVAERGHRVVGSIFLVHESDDEAKLRLLYVDADARGLGVGSHLVQTCIRTARSLGYRRLTLWTNDVLVAARRIYQAAGFALVREEAHHSFGKDLTGQYWALTL